MLCCAICIDHTSGFSVHCTISLLSEKGKAVFTSDFDSVFGKCHKIKISFTSLATCAVVPPKVGVLA